MSSAEKLQERPDDRQPDANHMFPLRRLPRVAGIDISFCTLWRLRERGAASVTGERVRLRTQRIGGQIYICMAWWSEFVAAQNAARDGGASEAQPSKAKARGRADAAASELSRSGW
jgi:hypothetical protein